MGSNKIQLRKILSTDLLPVVYNYLVSIGLDSVAQKLTSKSGLDLESSESPLAEKKLQKIVKFYVTNHKQMIQQFIVKPEASETEEEEVKSKKSSKKATLNGKRKQKKEQSDDDEDDKEEEEVKETKLSKKKLKKNKEEEQEKEIEEEEQEIQKVQQLIPSMFSSNDRPLREGERRYFQKCDDSRIHYIQTELKDNSHEAKKKFGHGDTFGDEGNDKLKVVQGKEFRKQKEKLKNKGYCKGDSAINTSQVNSIPL